MKTGISYSELGPVRCRFLLITWGSTIVSTQQLHFVEFSLRVSTVFLARGDCIRAIAYESQRPKQQAADHPYERFIRLSRRHVGGSTVEIVQPQMQMPFPPHLWKPE